MHNGSLRWFSAAFTEATVLNCTQLYSWHSGGAHSFVALRSDGSLRRTTVSGIKGAHMPLIDSLDMAFVMQQQLPPQ